MKASPCCGRRDAHHGERWCKPSPLFILKRCLIEQITVSSEEINFLADMIHETLVQHQVKVGIAICAAAVMIARLTTSAPIKVEEEMKFMQDLLEWSELYWGGQNERKH